MHESEVRAIQLAAQQHGLITTQQAKGVGLTADDVAHRVERGRWTWLTRRVLAITGSPATPLQRRMRFALDGGAGSALSHGYALEHWGNRGFVDEPPNLVRHRGHLDHKVRGATVHEVRYLPWDLVRRLDGIPVVTPALALLQLAGLSTVPDGRLERAIDAAWADRLVSYETLTAVNQRMSRQGRRGITRFRAMVEERGPTHVAPGSNIEGRFARILSDGGRPRMRRQVNLGSDERWIGRVDFLADDCPLVVEIQSDRFHRGLLAEADDLRRTSALQAAGFVVVEIAEEWLFSDTPKVLLLVDVGRTQALRAQAA